MVGGGVPQVSPAVAPPNSSAHIDCDEPSLTVVDRTMWHACGTPTDATGLERIGPLRGETSPEPHNPASAAYGSAVVAMGCGPSGAAAADEDIDASTVPHDHFVAVML